MQKKQLELISFCVTGWVEKCRQLLDAGVSLYCKNERGLQALHKAVFGGRYVRTGMVGDNLGAL